MSSAERIRKRFLHKIGIPPQNSTEKSTEGSQSSLIPIKSMNTKVELSRLGAVKPTYEQLNVGLDDDSSFDEDDESDDDYYFDDDHFPSEMDIDTFIRNSQNESIKKMFSIDNKKSLMEENEVQTNPQRAEDSSLVGSINIVSDNGSANSSLDGAGTNLNSATPCYSIGNLTFVSNDSSFDNRSTKRRRIRRKVSLNHNVEIVPIPMREEYPEPIKARIWSTASELYENAVRNSIEYAAEGWNWRTAIEDENMIIDNNSGVMIHPIHLHNLFRYDQKNPQNITQGNANPTVQNPTLPNSQIENNNTTNSAQMS